MKNLFLLLITGILLALQSCAPKITMVDTSCSAYKKENFTRDKIPDNGIAIMPVLGDGTKGQYRSEIGEALTTALRNAFEEAHVLSPSEVIKILNDKDLSDNYSSAIGNYIISGVVPKRLASQMGKAFSARYLLFVRPLVASENRHSIVQNKIEEIRVDELYLKSQIWDTASGDVVWEGKGGVAKLKHERDQDQKEKKKGKEKDNIVFKTAEGLSGVIGTERNSGPCKDEQDLIKSLEDAGRSTYAAYLGLGFLTTLIFLIVAG